MENDEEMSKTQAMWIKIKEPMAEPFPKRHTDNGVNSISCSQRDQNTSPSYLFDCNLATRSQSLNKNNSGIWCDCLQSKHSITQNRVWCSRWASAAPPLPTPFFFSKKTTLWVFEACPVQLPPTVPLAAVLSPLPLSDCLLPWQWKEVQLCGAVWAEWEKSAHFGWLSWTKPQFSAARS